MTIDTPKFLESGQVVYLDNTVTYHVPWWKFWAWGFTRFEYTVTIGSRSITYRARTLDELQSLIDTRRGR